MVPIRSAVEKEDGSYSVHDFITGKSYTVESLDELRPAGSSVPLPDETTTEEVIISKGTDTVTEDINNEDGSGSDPVSDQPSSVIAQAVSEGESNGGNTPAKKDSLTKAKMVHRNKTYDRCELVLPKGTKAVIKSVIDAKGLSFNSYVYAALKEKIQRDTGLNLEKLSRSSNTDM